MSPLGGSAPLDLRAWRIVGEQAHRAWIATGYWGGYSGCCSCGYSEKTTNTIHDMQNRICKSALYGGCVVWTRHPSQSRRRASSLGIDSLTPTGRDAFQTLLPQRILTACASTRVLVFGKAVFGEALHNDTHTQSWLRLEGMAHGRWGAGSFMSLSTFSSSISFVFVFYHIPWPWDILFTGACSSMTIVCRAESRARWVTGSVTQPWLRASHMSWLRKNKISGTVPQTLALAFRLHCGRLPPWPPNEIRGAATIGRCSPKRLSRHTHNTAMIRARCMVMSDIVFKDCIGASESRLHGLHTSCLNMFCGTSSISSTWNP